MREDREWRLRNLKYKWLRWIAAKLFGYSWGPCPLCRRSFAGFEVAPVYLVTKADPGEHYWINVEGQYVCYHCEDKAAESNMRYFRMRQISDKSVSVEIPATHFPPSGYHFEPGYIVKPDGEIILTEISLCRDADDSPTQHTEDSPDGRT